MIPIIPYSHYYWVGGPPKVLIIDMEPGVVCGSDGLRNSKSTRSRNSNGNCRSLRYSNSASNRNNEISYRSTSCP